QYYPELINLMKGRNYQLDQEVQRVLISLGPKAVDATPKLCQMLLSMNTKLDYSRMEQICSMISAIGPAAAPKAVPVLERCMKKLNQPEMFARSLANMGPEGVDVLKKYAATLAKHKDESFDDRNVCEVASRVLNEYVDLDEGLKDR